MAPREVSGANAVADTRPDLGSNLRDLSTGGSNLRDPAASGISRHWDVPPPLRQAQPRLSSRQVRAVVQQPETFERGTVTSPARATFGATIVQRTSRSRFGSIIRLAR
ncbi:MAG: hypothetical protein JOY61_25790 [Chloroflexi bacterium]|nr:hypothetical protein [Chloroflexota bacterium]